MTEELVQASFDYGLLTPAQAQRTQAAEVRVIGRTHKAIIENGRDLLAVKVDIGRGHFRTWVQSIGLSHDTAERWINVAQNFGEMTHGASFENSALYLLSTSNVPETAREEAKQRAAGGEKITEEIAKEIRDAHQAREEAEKNMQATQQQLTLFSRLSNEKIDTLTQQINGLEEKLRTAETPKSVEVIPQEILDKITDLEELTAKQKQRIDSLCDHITKLNTELHLQRDANEARRKQEAYEQRIKNGWRKATDTLYKAVSEFNGQLPSPIDLQVFEGEEWARHAKTEEALRYALSQLTSLKGAKYQQVVNDVPVYETSLVEVQQ